MALDCDGKQRPSQRKRHKKPNLQRLPDSSIRSDGRCTLLTHPLPPRPGGQVRKKSTGTTRARKEVTLE
jgi:hypothetical protein